MCRLLGIVANERTDFHLSLRAAPRSMAELSREHRDGWGLAVYDAALGWTVERQETCAGEDPHYHHAAAHARVELLVAHVRRRTVGPVGLHNTHPFRRGRWVFAHNGTIEKMDLLRERVSSERRAEVQGETDSELFFAYLLTELDRAGVGELPACATTDHVLRTVMRELDEVPGFGASNFILSDGEMLYAHRCGRTLFVLARAPFEPVHATRESRETGAIIGTPWSAARLAVLVASERLTDDEPWAEVPERTLIRVERAPVPRFADLARL